MAVHPVPNVNVYMVCPTLAAWPAYPLPAPYSLRWYQPGDDATWFAVQRASEKFATINDTLHAREFGTDPAPLAQRQAFLLDGDGVPIGTASAWWDAQWQGLAWGRIHWVAIVPAYQGRGLAKPLLAAVMARMAGLGHERAYLVTSTGRLPALRLYLQFGFRPWLATPPDHAAWDPVRPLLADLWEGQPARLQAE